MNPYRDLKRRARRQLHAHMSEPVWFLETADSDPVLTTVRLHFKFDRLGELLRGGFADRQEELPKLIFMGVKPRRGSLVVTEDMGVYRVDNASPPDDITVTAEVVKLTPSQLEGYGMDPALPWAGMDPAEPESDDD